MIRSVHSTYSAIRRVSRSAITAGPEGRTCVHTPILGTLRRSRTYRTTSHPIHINDLEAQLAADLWGVGQWWSELVARRWEQTVAASLAAVKAEPSGGQRPPGVPGAASRHRWAG